MLTSVIGVIIALAVLAIVYILIKWILGYMSLPAQVITILNIVVGVIAIVIILSYLVTFIH